MSPLLKRFLILLQHNEIPELGRKEWTLYTPGQVNFFLDPI
ncbi:MAG TPA: hypothetical protein VIP81_27950 [Chitinophaga sp.]